MVTAIIVWVVVLVLLELMVMGGKAQTKKTIDTDESLGWACSTLIVSMLDWLVFVVGVLSIVLYAIYYAFQQF